MTTKKITKVVVTSIIALFIILMTSCQFIDNENATLEIKTSTGKTVKLRSVNDSNVLGESAKSLVTKFSRLNPILLEENETAEIHFFCSACGHEEKIIVRAPYSQIFECDCPLFNKNNKILHKKEFAAIEIKTNYKNLKYSNKIYSKLQ